MSTIQELDASLAVVLDQLAAENIAAAGGSAAAVVAAMAASLVMLSARAAVGAWGDADGAVAQGGALRRRSQALATAAAEAYADAAQALRDRDRDRDLGTKLQHAADVPLQVARVAADVAALADEVAERGNPDRLADAVVAGLLARSAVASASHLVEVNLALTAGDPRRGEVDELRRSVSSSAEKPDPRR
jgi:methenyltetrahydrofolate cyclohydrolase